MMNDNLYGTILPIDVQVYDFSTSESVNTTLADGSVTQELPTVQLLTAKKSIFYAGAEYDFSSPLGRIHGEATQADYSAPLMKGEATEQSVAIMPPIHKFNVIRSIPPFYGDLISYFDMLSAEVGFTGRRIIYWQTEDKITAPGFFGNVFENLVATLTTLKMDMTFVYDMAIVRPTHSNQISSRMFKSPPQISYSDQAEYRYIKCWYYNPTWDESFTFYPITMYRGQDVIPTVNTERDNPGEIWLPPMRIQSQEILAVDSLYQSESAYVEQVFDVDASLSEINQPVCTLPPMVIVENATGYSGDVVYRFINRWSNLGILNITGTGEAILDNYDIKRGLVGQLALWDDVIYQCGVSYYIPEADIPQTNYMGEVTESEFNAAIYADGDWYDISDFDVTHPGEGIFGKAIIYSGLPVISKAENAQWHICGAFYGYTDMDHIDDIVRTSPTFLVDNITTPSGNDAALLENGYYCVTGKDGWPIVPSVWEDGGGSLVIELQPDKSSFKVKLWGAKSPLDYPVYSAPPTGVDIGFVYAYDISGKITDSSIFYERKTDSWEVVDIDPFPYSPYRIAIGSGSSEIGGLVLTGRGLRYDKDSVIVESARWGDAGTDVKPADSTAEIDSPRIKTLKEAIGVAHRYDFMSNGMVFSMSGEIDFPNENDFMTARRGSFQDVIDYMLYHGYSMDTGNRIEFDTWWATHLSNDAFVRDDIDNKIMADTQHFVAANTIGSIAGSYIYVDNRAIFRITDAEISPDGISINGIEDTRFGDLDDIIRRVNPNMTLGDIDDLYEEIAKVERITEYEALPAPYGSGRHWKLGFMDQEPARFVV